MSLQELKDQRAAMIAQNHEELINLLIADLIILQIEAVHDLKNVIMELEAENNRLNREKHTVDRVKEVKRLKT